MKFNARLFSIIGIGVIVVGVGGLWYLTHSNKAEVSPIEGTLLQPPIEGERVDDSGYTIDYSYTRDNKPHVLLFVSSDGYPIPVPEEVAVKIDQAVRFTKTGKGEGETLESPVYPRAAWRDLLFIATNEYVPETSEDGLRFTVINRIYTYDLDAATPKKAVLKEIYKEESVGGAPLDPESGRVLWTMGMDGSKLILFFQTPMNSPGPCTSPWYHYKDSFGYLEFADFAGGITPYTVPEKKIEEEKKKFEECRKEIESERPQ